MFETPRKNILRTSQSCKAVNGGSLRHEEIESRSWGLSVYLKMMSSPYCAISVLNVREPLKQIDLIRYEPLTLSLRRLFNSFSNSFASIMGLMAVDMKL